MPGSNIGTVTNSNGAFTLKLDSAKYIPYLEISPTVRFVAVFGLEVRLVVGFLVVVFSVLAD